MNDNKNPDVLPEIQGMPPLNGLVSEVGPDFSFSEFDIKQTSVPVMPLRLLTPFPFMSIPIPVDRENSIKILQDAAKNKSGVMLVSQKDPSMEEPGPDDIYRVGVLAVVLQMVEMPDGSHTALVVTLSQSRIVRITRRKPYMRANIDVYEYGGIPEKDREFDVLVESVYDTFKAFLDLAGEENTRELRYMVSRFSNPIKCINFISMTSPMGIGERQELLEERDFKVRYRKLLNLLDRACQLLQLKSDLHERTHEELSQRQREQYLQSQMRAIQDELGGGVEDSDEATLIARAEKKEWSEAAKEHFGKELKKLQRFNIQNPEYSIQYAYLDTLLNLPWDHLSDDNFQLSDVERILDRDHFGMEKVKDRIIEHMAVLKLRHDMKAPIICLYGPPGVGKTSLGRSIAEALGREYARVSLGGLHDEAEIRGHRRTYIGAMPGRIISALSKCGSGNPVFVLDEIDKIGKDFKGDPSTALLEVLDPEQNSKFHDNFVDFDYDLSKILFIATANSLSTISTPLLDRMELIEISGYIAEEKVEIARKHLWPKVLDEHGFEPGEISLSTEAFRHVVDYYTRESGVRHLDKQLAKIARKLARMKASGQVYPREVGVDEVSHLLGKQENFPDVYESNDYAGVVTGLAWTSVGGEILFIESSLSDGKDAKLTLTGNLGDVMKESAVIALQYLKAHAGRLGIDRQQFAEHDVHIHVPEGAVPKDGPSAGVTIATSLASAFTGRRVRDKIAMTGEITLRGKVLPVGGIKEKILAAKRAGITEILLSSKNRKDVEEIPERYLCGLKFRYVERVEDVLDYALLDEKASY